MEERNNRTEMLITKEKQELLKSKKVIVFGLGGVGSYAVEALIRASIGTIGIVDHDCFDVTNLNRQLYCTEKTVGKNKVSVTKERINEVNSSVKVNCYDLFYNEDTAKSINLNEYDYIIDAIDSVTSKLLLIKKAKELNIPIISSMGTGNKLNPEKFQIADINKTSVCPLAKVMRHELKKMGIDNLTVLFSTEEPVKTGSKTPGSISFCPSVAGLLIAGYVIKDLIK